MYYMEAFGVWILVSIPVHFACAVAYALIMVKDGKTKDQAASKADRNFNRGMIWSCCGFWLIVLAAELWKGGL